jgi:mitogen-activated protein kinase kinase kinase
MLAPASAYGLPSDPRPGNTGGKPPIGRTPSPLQSSGTRNPPRPTAVIVHGRNISYSSVESPAGSTHNKLPPRPSTGNNHPYASTQSSLAPMVQQNLVLSPIAESFVSQGTGRSPPNAFTVGSGPFKGTVTPSHNSAPSVDDLRRKLVKFMLPEEGHSCTINVADCAGGIEVMEKVLKKFGKGGNRSSEAESTMEHVRTEEGGLVVDGWGVFIDWGQGGGTGKFHSLDSYHCR